MARRARIAVVGCGSWAVAAHLPSLAANPDAEVVAIADTNTRNLEYVAERWGIDAKFADVLGMLASVEPDGVIVATPPDSHAELALMALRAGGHVLVEKPFVLDPRAGAEVVRVAAEVGREVILSHPWHFTKQAQEVRQLVSTGELGEIQLISCTFASDVLAFYRGATDTALSEGYALAPLRSSYSDPAIAGGGQGQTQLSHAISLIRFVTGLGATHVACAMETLDLRIDVIDAAILRLENGALATLASTGAIVPGAPALFHLALFGDRGQISWEVRSGVTSIRTQHRSGELLSPLEEYPRGQPARNLVDVVLGQDTNRSPASIGIHTAAILEAMHRSAGGETEKFTPVHG